MKLIENQSITVNNPPKNNFCLGLNIRSLRKHFDELLVELSEYKHLPHLILLTETWLTENDDLSNFNIAGYQPFESKPRTNGQLRGGVGIYVSNQLSMHPIHFETNLECLIMKILFNENDTKIICILYRPDSVKINFFLDEFEKLLAFLHEQKHDIILFGDFNIDTLVESCDLWKYKNVLNSYSLSIRNFLPTRVTATSATCLDHAITFFPVNTKTIKMTISDHYAVEMELDFCSAINKTDENIFKTRCLQNIKGPKALNFLFLLDQKLRSIDETVEVNEHALRITQAIQSCVDRFAPEKVRKFKQGTWITCKIKNQIRRRNKFFQRMICNPTEENKEEYRKIRNEVTHSIRCAKRDYNYEKLGKNPTMKKLYQVLKSEKHTYQPPLKTPNAETFNQYFSKIGEKLAKNLDKTEPRKFERLQSTMVLATTNEQEIKKILENLKPKRSTGHDEISNEILKCCSPIIEKYLTTLFNKCIEARVFPETMKIAKVIPFFKNGDKNQPENYRPISLLTAMSKIFEKLLLKRMTKFVTKHKILSSSQFGFRKNYNCTNAITEITEFIRQEIDKQNRGYVCFIDLKKAFDTIDHELLLVKLELYGFRGPIFELIQNYLQNRNQYVYHQGKNSSLTTVTTGVPQGSILGPFLFLLYINDLPDCITKSRVALFADDTSLYNFGPKARDEICNDVKIARCWFTDNKLTINTDKCESLGFGIREPFPSQAFGVEIRSQSHCKYLGVYLDPKLTFKRHVEHVTKKLNKFCGIVYRIRDRFPQKGLISFYYAYAQSVITYGLINYGSTYKTNLEPIDKAQRRIFRAIFYRRKWDTLQDIYTKHKFLNIYEMFIAEVVKEVFKQLRFESPRVYLNNTLATHDYNTRRKQRGLLPSTHNRLVLKQRSLTNVLRKAYNWLLLLNLIPPDLRNIAAEQINKIVKNINEVYIIDNKELFELFF